MRRVSRPVQVLRRLHKTQAELRRQVEGEEVRRGGGQAGGLQLGQAQGLQLLKTPPPEWRLPAVIYRKTNLFHNSLCCEQYIWTLLNPSLGLQLFPATIGSVRWTLHCTYTALMAPHCRVPQGGAGGGSVSSTAQSAFLSVATATLHCSALQCGCSALQCGCSGCCAVGAV